MKTPTLGTSIIERSPLEGVRLFLYPTSTKDVVSLRGSFFGGMMHAQAVHPLASLFVARLLDKGTKRKSKEKIQHELEKRGIEISFSVSAQRIGFEVYCRAGVAHEAVRLLGEMIREPLFSETEFLNERVLFEGELHEEEGNTYARGAVMFSQRVFGPTHPGYLYSVAEKREYLQTLTLENVKAFYESVCGRGSLICVVVGDIDVRDIESYVRKEFQGLREVAIGELGERSLQTNPSSTVVRIPEKASVDVFLGLPLALSIHDEAYLPLSLGTSALGYSFASRLWDHFRETLGISYSISASLVHCEGQSHGAFLAYASFASENGERGERELQKIVEKFARDGITNKEYKERQSMLEGLFKVGLSSTRGVSAAIHNAIANGFSKEYLDEYPKRVRKTTLRDVNKAIQTHIGRKPYTIVKSGSI